jgi:hypothetical protein
MILTNRAGIRLCIAEYIWLTLIIIVAIVGGAFGLIGAVQSLVKLL